MRRKLLPLALCLTLVASPASAADYALGLVAFDRGDVVTAHREFSALAAQGHRAAQYSLAMLYLKIEPPQYARAIPWLEKSARSGLPESQYMLGMLSLNGVGMAKNAEQGMRWLEMASGQGNEDAQAQLDQLKQARLREAESERRKVEQARSLRTELDEAKASEQVLQRRLAKSKEREKSLASKPASAADYALGLVAFDRGDVVTAHREFSALAEQGHPAAQYSLAMLYLKIEPPQYARAIPWLEKSARSGLPESQYMLGMLSLYGVGVTKNADQGMRWLEMASGQGNEDAQAQLDQLKQARLREAESERRKVEQARSLRTELDKAKASEQALQRRLAKSKEREKSLVSERETLEKARASDTRAKEEQRREQARLQAELEALRAQLAEAERARMESEAAKSKVVEEEVVLAAKADVADASAEAVVAGKVVEILPDGVVLADVSRRVKGRSEPFPDGLVVFLNLASTEGLSEGEEVAYPAEPATPYRYKYDSGATGRIRAFRAIGE